MKLLIFIIFTILEISTPTKFDQSFSASVYRKISKSVKGNFFVSPASVETLLSLTQKGSKGETFKELEELNLTNIEKIPSRVPTLQTTNKLYIANNFSIKTSFKKATQKYLEFENTDFGKESSINSWIKNHTNIKNFVKHPINSRTKLLFVNTISFKARWFKPFFPAIHNYKFHVSSSETIEAPTMFLHEEFLNYYENPQLGARFLELPFKEKASMVIVLPDKIDGLSKVESQPRNIFRAKFTKRLVNAGLPRFSIKDETDFKKILKRMGVTKIFDGENADLSGISGEKGELIVNDIVQKTFIFVNESGIEATGVTLLSNVLEISAPTEIPKKFVVDRPFIFYIKIQKIVYFVGRVIRPN